MKLALLRGVRVGAIGWFVQRDAVEHQGVLLNDLWCHRCAVEFGLQVEQRACTNS